MVTIASILKDLISQLETRSIIGQVRPLTQSIENAADLMYRVFTHSVTEPLAAVQGPPGTGKTELARITFSNEDVLNKLLGENWKVIYIAPTNELTTSAFYRMLPILTQSLMRIGFTLKDIVRSFRIYGSSVPRPYYSHDEISTLKNYNIDEDDVKKMVYGGVDKNVRFIFTTEYQRVTGKVFGGNYQYVLFIDEASRSPFYLPFTPVADAMQRELTEMRRQGILAALSIVGDPEQAIAIGDEYRVAGKRYLALSQLVEILKRLGAVQNFKMLEETIRIPSPLHEPISEAFYSGKLRAIMNAPQRFRSVKLKFNLRKCSNTLGSNYGWICESIENAVSSGLPLIVVNTDSVTWGDGYSEDNTYDPARIRYAVHYAAAFISGIEPEVDVAVIGPYVQLVNSASFYYAQRYPGLRRPRFLTVHSMLGGEADVIIAMLGKEFTTREPDYWTIHYAEPETLNVELSRARLMMVVIGDVYRLKSSAARLRQHLELSRGSRRISRRILSNNAEKLKIAAEKMLELTGKSFKRGERSMPSTGYGGIYIPKTTTY